MKGPRLLLRHEIYLCWSEFDVLSELNALVLQKKFEPEERFLEQLYNIRVSYFTKMAVTMFDK